ncbi:MAG: nucleotidyltransferase domain-containing protein [Snowella sp.]|nr:nucleotidyltransferase domain-containing protein [Snowella sp.]
MELSKNIKNSAKITNQLSLGNQTVPAEQIAIYRKTAEQNLQNSHVQRETRREKACRLVQLASSLLKEKLGAAKVMVFGSLIHEDCFTLWSDVDIAAWGISPLDTFHAMGEIRELDESIEINLEAGCCR